MANCHDLFLKFDGELNITPGKTRNLLNSARVIETRIKNHFKNYHPKYTPKFSFQGSYMLKTMIRTKDDLCDIDLGVYILEKPKVSARKMQEYVWNALENQTDYSPIHKNKCLRIDYANQYDIDIAVYYQGDISQPPLLATRDNDWITSDPLNFYLWVMNHPNYCPQLIRVIRYLKSWNSKATKKTPPGIALTVLVVNNFKKDEFDDIALYNTINAIKLSLKMKYEVLMPVAPKDDLLIEFKIKERKKYFIERIEELMVNAERTIYEEENQLKASKIWKRQMGFRFPEGSAKFK